MTLDEFLYLVDRERFRAQAYRSRVHERLDDADARISRCRACGAWKYGARAHCKTRRAA